MRAIELRQLRYFWLLAKELHFGRAAELAFITQPALSQQIAKLEALIGVQLLIRDRRHVTLTPAGISLRDDAQALFEQLDQTLRRARAATTDQDFRISIGLVEYTNLPFVPPALMRLQQLYPDLKVERHEMNGSTEEVSPAQRFISSGTAHWPPLSWQSISRNVELLVWKVVVPMTNAFVPAPAFGMDI